MSKAIVQGFITISLFFGIWFGLYQIDWVNIFKIKKMTNKTEEKLGDLFLDIFKSSHVEYKNSEVVNTIDSLLSHICKANDINKKFIKIHVLSSSEVNAFALPNGHLVVYSGLILKSQNQEEFVGVLCHEIAHIELDHIMKKLIKEVGLSILISMTTGNSGGEVIKETAKLLSSSAFDRSLEKEADLKAVEYMVKANVNPEPFANFLYTLDENENPKIANWVSTHPDSKERSEYVILESRNYDKEYKSILKPESWEALKVGLDNLSNL